MIVVRYVLIERCLYDRYSISFAWLRFGEFVGYSRKGKLNDPVSKFFLLQVSQLVAKLTAINPMFIRSLHASTSLPPARSALL